MPSAEVRPQRGVQDAEMSGIVEGMSQILTNINYDNFQHIRNSSILS